jgi:hypothetical protein
MKSKLQKEFFEFYKVFRTTNLMAHDIKDIKRINTKINKYKRTGKERYLYEIKNLFIVMNNLFNANEKFITFVGTHFLDDFNTEMFENLYEEYEKTRN